jgi:hypothetical protein
MVDPKEQPTRRLTDREWITKMAELEDGCDVSAGSIDVLIDGERVEE